MPQMPRLNVFPRRITLRDAAVALLAGLLLAGTIVIPAASQTETYPDSGYTRVVDMTFPLSGDTTYVDSYFDSRGGGTRTHRATDLMADKMVPVHATVDGEVCKATGIDEPMPYYGYALTLCGDDGLEYGYIHINNDTPGTDDGQGGPENAYAPGIKEGVRVERGQHIAYVGDSGNAEGTSPHIHFEIYDDAMDEQSGRLNPYPSLLAAEDRGDYPDSPEPMVSESPSEQPPSDEPSEEPPSEEPSEEPPSEEPSEEPSENPSSGEPYTRLSGPTRLQTAVALSQSSYDDGPSEAVIIVPADSHVEALIAAPLAGLLNAPILLSGPDGLDGDVIAEIERLGPKSAYLIGSTSQLTETVAADVTAAGIAEQARIVGADRYALSAAVAEVVLSHPIPAGNGMILALGDAEESSRAWPDALSATALAARTVTPVLLTEGDRLPDAVADILSAQRPGVLTVVGGTAAITDAVADEAAELAGAEVHRLAGATRYATSVAVAEAAQDAGLADARVWIATGLNFPDALAAGPAAAVSGSPLVLIDGLDIDGAPSSAGWLQDQAEELVVVGGEAVISDDVAAGLSH